MVGVINHDGTASALHVVHADDPEADYSHIGISRDEVANELCKLAERLRSGKTTDFILTLSVLDMSCLTRTELTVAAGSCRTNLEALDGLHR